MILVDLMRICTQILKPNWIQISQRKWPNDQREELLPVLNWLVKSNGFWSEKSWLIMQILTMGGNS